MGKEKTFLTEKQLEVMRLRAEGLTQAEIAKRLDTSRANICSLEKRAEENVERAKNTIHLAKRTKAPVRMKIHKDDDILDSVKKLFSEADEAGIHVLQDTPGLISEIREQAGERLEGRRASEEIELSLTHEGKVLIN